MEIPIKLRRRIPELEKELNNVFETLPDYGASTHKELFIFSLSKTLSTYVVFNYHPEIWGDDIHKQVDIYLPYVKYIFRNKMSQHWEKVREKVNGK